jgi:DNA-binding MarR family transcriptional regulator
VAKRQSSDDKKSKSLNKAQEIAHSLLKMRRNQNKADAEFLAALGTLNSQQLNVLNIIGDNQPCPITNIAYITSLPLSNVTLQIEKLVRKKLAKRQRSEQDQRVTYVELSVQGQAIYQKQIDQMAVWADIVLSTLTPEEQDVLLKCMQRFSEGLK